MLNWCSIWQDCKILYECSIHQYIQQILDSWLKCNCNILHWCHMDWTSPPADPCSLLSLHLTHSSTLVCMIRPWNHCKYNNPHTNISLTVGFGCNHMLIGCSIWQDCNILYECSITQYIHQILDYWCLMLSKDNTLMSHRLSFLSKRSMSIVTTACDSIKHIGVFDHTMEQMQISLSTYKHFIYSKVLGAITCWMVVVFDRTATSFVNAAYHSTYIKSLTTSVLWDCNMHH